MPRGKSPEEWGDVQRISKPYLIVIGNVLRRYEGKVWADPLWHKDLFHHLAFIDRLTLFSPIAPAAPGTDWLELDHPRLTILSSPWLRDNSGWTHWRVLMELGKAIGRTEILHSSVVGSPIPPAWLVIPAANLAGRTTVVVVESSPWRVGAKASVRSKTRGLIHEAVNRLCLRICHVTFFTSPSYRDSMVGSGWRRAYISPAVWVDAEEVLTREEAAANWDRKSGRVLFAGRFTSAKGIEVLLDAVSDSSVGVDFIGEGPLGDAINQLAKRNPDRIGVLSPVPYGSEFFALLDRYNAVLVPTITDEQPRIIFDAFARGIPPIVSDSPGNCSVVEHGATGIIVPRGDNSALAEAINDACGDPSLMKEIGLRALEKVAGMTHRSMHRGRAEIISNIK